MTAHYSQQQTRIEGDLESLVGLRSIKTRHYAQLRGSEQRLIRVISAFDRISRALVRTADGPEALVASVVDAAREHLGARWVVFALGDGHLEQTSPRHLLMDGAGTTFAFEGAAEAREPATVPDEVLNRLTDILRNQVDQLAIPIAEPHHVHAPLELYGKVVGGLSAWIGDDRSVDPSDVVVLRILASQAMVALLNAALLDESRRQLDRAERAHAQTARHAEDLAVRNAELEQAQRELSTAMRERLLGEERGRIARELHDSVTQSVLSAGVQIELCRRENLTDPSGRLATAGELTRGAVDQLRSVIYTLNHTPPRETGGLREALVELSSMHVPGELATEVTTLGIERDLHDNVQHAVLRVAGEALFNAAMHANATRVQITLTFFDDRVTLAVDDDGDGDPDHLRRVLRTASAGDLAGRHRGLVNMRTRVAELGGRFSIRRSRLGGVRISAAVPAPTTPPDSPAVNPPAANHSAANHSAADHSVADSSAADPTAADRVTREATR